MSDVTGDLQLFLIVLFNSSPEEKQYKQVRITQTRWIVCLLLLKHNTPVKFYYNQLI
jgi:hypothetical protein